MQQMGSCNMFKGNCVTEWVGIEHGIEHGTVQGIEHGTVPIEKWKQLYFVCHTSDSSNSR